MKNPLATEFAGNLGLLLARIPLGLYFAMAGYNHLLTQYVANLPDWMPLEAAKGYCAILPFLEMAAGALLLLGLTVRFGGLLAATITGMAIATNGFKLHPAPGHLVPVTFGLALLLLCVGGGKVSMDHFLFKKKQSIEIEG